MPPGDEKSKESNLEKSSRPSTFRGEEEQTTNIHERNSYSTIYPHRNECRGELSSRPPSSESINLRENLWYEEERNELSKLIIEIYGT